MLRSPAARRAKGGVSIGEPAGHTGRTKGVQDHRFLQRPVAAGTSALRRRLRTLGKIPSRHVTRPDGTKHSRWREAWCVGELFVRSLVPR